MDSFELTKAAGAVLGTLLFAMGTGLLTDLIYAPKPAGKAGYDLPEPAPASGGGKAEAAKVEPIAVRLAGADAEKGKGDTKACHSCHSFEKGGPNGIGPALWDVVERPKGSHEGFGYSAGMKEKGGTWTYEDLDHFLENPKAFIKGTKMQFSGISSPQERANVIAYLRTLSDSPKPLPAAEAKEEAKPDGGAKGDGKPAEAAPAGAAKPAESKPAEKPADAQKADKKPEAAKPADTPPEQPTEAKPEGEKTEGVKPAEKPAEGQKPAEGKPAPQ